jgi:autotransporter translocation and assembly factor TamB
MLAGQLSAVNGLYTKPFTGGETPEAPRDPRLRFDLDFEVGSNIVIRNELVNAPIQGRLHLAGTDQSPLLQGRLLMGSGVIYANENEFRIAQGNIAFTGAPSNIPIVNLEASTNFRTPNQTYRIQISANGPGDALNFGFSSEPSLPTADIVNLLAFGILRPGDSATGTEISSESNAANAAQWQALQMLFGKALGQNLDRRTGIQVRVQTAQSKTQAEAIPKLTVHRKLTDRVSVVVGSSLDQRQPEKDVQVDYRLFNNVNLTGVWENPKPDESSMGVDLRFKFDLK